MNRQRRLLRPDRLALVVCTVVAAWSGTANAGIVTVGHDPQPLPNCPWTAIGLPGTCLVQTAAQVQGNVGDLSQVRIGRGGQGSLWIDADATLLVNRTNLSTSPLIPSVPDVVVGDDVGSVASLDLTHGGRLTIDIASTTHGGLIIGPFAAPPGNAGPLPPPFGPSVGPSTTMTILDDSQVNVNKPGGTGIGPAVTVGYGAGSNSSLLMDGGISGFGVQAKRAVLTTTGNMSIGREGIGSVAVFRNAELTANVIWMSTVAPQGESVLSVGYGSTLNASGIIAGIALANTPSGYDEFSPNHGTAVIATRDNGWINAPIVLGHGGTLMGTGTVAQVLNLGGTIRPGLSPGTMTIAGDYTDVGGHVVIEIGPTASDFLSVAGNLSMSGSSIEFSFVDGFAPDAGFSYDFIDAAGNVDLNDLHFSYSGLQPGFLFTVDYDTNGEPLFRALNNGVSLPEPALPALLALAALAAWATRRRG